MSFADSSLLCSTQKIKSTWGFTIKPFGGSREYYITADSQQVGRWVRTCRCRRRLCTTAGCSHGGAIFFLLTLSFAAGVLAVVCAAHTWQLRLEWMDAIAVVAASDRRSGAGEEESKEDCVS